MGSIVVVQNSSSKFLKEHCENFEFGSNPNSIVSNRTEFDSHSIYFTFCSNSVWFGFGFGSDSGSVLIRFGMGSVDYSIWFCSGSIRIRNFHSVVILLISAWKMWRTKLTAINSPIHNYQHLRCTRKCLNFHHCISTN